MRSGPELTTWLSTSPLAWLTLTVSVWLAADRIATAANRHPLVNPLLISVAVIVIVLKSTGASYATYLSGSQPLQLLIGPAVVALAVPLFENWATVKRNILPIVIALPVGCVTALLAASCMARALALPEVVTASLAPKSVTTGAALAISLSLGGEPAMTATFTVSTSIVTAIALVSFAKLLRVRDPAAIGFAAGLTGHSVGAARAFEVDPVAGTFAGIALCLNAILTTFIVSGLHAMKVTLW
jgi:putative effector of murein hydrolase